MVSAKRSARVSELAEGVETAAVEDGFARVGGILAAVELGGTKTNYGDTSVVIPAFSRVPINIVIWKGDEEFPPNASILFDETVLDYLSAEDINVLCQTLTWRLVKSLKLNEPHTNLGR